MVGFEANGTSVTSGDVTTGARGQLPNEFVYDVGVDAYATKRITGIFDIIGQRIFNTQSLAISSTKYLAPCTSLITIGQGVPQMGYYDKNNTNLDPNCTVFVQPQPPPQPTNYFNSNGSQISIINPSFAPATVSLSNVSSTSGVSTNITNASAGVKIALVKRLVLSLNILVRLDEGGLHSKPAPLAALGYTF
jgi:hypothetical protein